MEWINIKDRLPEEEQQCWVWMPDSDLNGNMAFGIWEKGAWWDYGMFPQISDDDKFTEHVTHWMPLPPPPGDTT